MVDVCLLSIPDGVQIFFISPNGLVSAPSYPTALHIVTFDRDSEQSRSIHAGAPPAFLYVRVSSIPLFYMQDFLPFLNLIIM